MIYLFVKPKAANWTYTLVIDQKAWGKKSPIYLLLSNLTDIMMNIFMYLVFFEVCGWRILGRDREAYVCIMSLYPHGEHAHVWEQKQLSAYQELLFHPPFLLNPSCFSKSLFSFHVSWNFWNNHSSAFSEKDWFQVNMKTMYEHPIISLDTVDLSSNGDYASLNGNTVLWFSLCLRQDQTEWSPSSGGTPNIFLFLSLYIRKIELLIHTLS